MTERLYDPDDWPHGLRCVDCDRRFIVRQPISGRLEGFVDDYPLVTIVCAGCAIGPA